MRRFVLALALAAAAAAPAMAQPVTPYQSGFTNASTAVGALQAEQRDWVLSETGRQAYAPTSIDAIDKGLEENVAPHLQGPGKSLRATRKDLLAAIRFEIVREARRMVDRELRDRKKDAKAAPSDETMLAMQALEGRRVRLGALESQASRRLTDKAREIIAD